MTPSRIESVGSPSSRSASTAMRVPRPEHSGQAPNGALNENVRGSISASWIGWLFGQESCSEKLRHACAPSWSTKFTCTTPSVSDSAVSSESVSRVSSSGLGDEAVDDDGDVVLELLLQRLRRGELHGLAVDDGPRVALRLSSLKRSTNSPFFWLTTGDDDLEAGALRQLHELVGDLLHRLAGDDLAADRAVRHADARPEQPHVVPDLGDRADRRARVAVRRLLVDRHRGREPLDEVDVGPVHLAEELAGVGRERLDVPALPLCEDGVEREGRLAAAGQPGEDDEGVPRDLDGDVLQVVDPGASDAELGAGPHPRNRHQTSVRSPSDTTCAHRRISATRGCSPGLGPVASVVSGPERDPGVNTRGTTEDRRGRW